jgi:hypothetical protein
VRRIGQLRINGKWKKNLEEEKSYEEMRKMKKRKSIKK